MSYFSCVIVHFGSVHVLLELEETSNALSVSTNTCFSYTQHVTCKLSLIMFLPMC